MRKNLLKKVGASLGGYAAACVISAFACSLPSIENHISPSEAREILSLEQRTFPLKGKKINLDFESAVKMPGNVGGGTYSSEGEYTIVMDSNWIDKKVLLHEIGHTILRPPSKEKYTPDFSETELSKTDVALWVLSPRELFCNLYGVARSFKY